MRILYLPLLLFVVFAPIQIANASRAGNALDAFVAEANLLIEDLTLGSTKESEFDSKIKSLRDKYQKKLKNLGKARYADNIVVVDKFLRDKIRFTVYKIRTSRTPDGRLTDDEITPVVFQNGVLTNIGWSGF